jgi:hypothetical protein
MIAANASWAISTTPLVNHAKQAAALKEDAGPMVTANSTFPTSMNTFGEQTPR